MLIRRWPILNSPTEEISSIADRDDMYGVLAHVKRGRDTYVLPLCDLEATGHSSVNYQPLNDYVVWFANR